MLTVSDEHDTRYCLTCQSEELTPMLAGRFAEESGIPLGRVSFSRHVRAGQVDVGCFIDDATDNETRAAIDFVRRL